MECRLLGELELFEAGRPLAVRGSKQRAILAMLLLHRGEVLPSMRLLDAVWGDDSPANPRNALQVQISQLRRTVPAGVIVSRNGGYGVDAAAVEVDIDDFDRGRRIGFELLAGGELSRGVTALRRSLDRWRGEPLVEFDDLEDARRERARLTIDRLHALDARIEAELAMGLHADLLAELDTLCDLHPFEERLWVHKMVALYRCGRQADALRAFTEVRARLVEELGIEPGPALRHTEGMVLAQAPELDWPGYVPATASLLTPSTAARPGGEPAPRSARLGNLPADVTPLIGRHAHLDELSAALRHSRLVTIVGPGGAGKTRLAVEVARRMSPAAAGGAWLVELAAVADPAGVPAAIAGALEVSRVLADVPAGSSSSVEHLARALADRPTLVVLDNCEHLIDAAALACETMLRAAPELRVLATSREPLKIAGEQLHPLGPLEPEAAMELFRDRARAAAADLGEDDSALLVADICRRLDGLPLAIELAAARLRSLPVRQVAARLDDRFRLLTTGARTALPRQQTLRAVVDWSYDLLADDERRLFTRLSCFVGGGRLDAIEAVCADALLPCDEVLDLLGQLVDKSLVTTRLDPDGEPRYVQLHTLREYGTEKLVAAGELGPVRRRHAEWFLSLAERAEEGLRGPSGPATRRLVDAEMENLRLALDWFVSEGAGEHAQRLVTGMAWQWFLRYDPNEARRWFGDALAVDGRPSPRRWLAEAWNAYFAAIVDGTDRHLPAGWAALEALEVTGEPEHHATAALLQTSSLIRAERPADALDVLAGVGDVVATLDSDWGLAMIDLLASNALTRLGRLEEAALAAHASIERFEAVGEVWALMEPLGNLAAIRATRGDTHGALAAYDRLIATTEALDLPGYRAFWLIWRGVSAARSGREQQALADLAEAARTSLSPVNTATAAIALSRSLARMGRPGAAAARCEQAAEIFAGLRRSDGEAAAAVASTLCLLDANRTAEAEAAAATAVGQNADLGALATAAVALHRARTEDAAVALDNWAARHLPAVPGTLPALFELDHVMLRARSKRAAGSAGTVAAASARLADQARRTGGQREAGDLG